MADLREGQCQNCQQVKMVAPCCVEHGILVCGDCFNQSGTGMSGHGCRIMEMVLDMEQHQTGRPDTNEVMAGYIPSDDVPVPTGELAAFAIGSAVSHRYEYPDVEIKVVTVFVTVMYPVPCAGAGADHPPHMNHVMQEGSFMVDVDMIPDLIKGLQEAADGTMEEKAEEWIDKGLEKMMATTPLVGSINHPITYPQPEAPAPETPEAEPESVVYWKKVKHQYQEDAAFVNKCSLCGAPFRSILHNP